MRVAISLLALWLTACSCGDPLGPADAGSDARRADTGGPPMDAAMDDATLSDAGLDAAEDDAGDDAAGDPDAGPDDAGVDAGSDAGADAGPPPIPVRFVVMGDTGEGNADQRAVAVQIRDVCAAEGCDFVVLLGDNIYNSGVDSVTDDQWRTKFEEPYRDIDLPFYPVLGNHDYGGRLIVETGGLGNEFFRGPIEVAYSAVSERWEMPATHYTLLFENVGFVMLDTNSILWNNTENGDQWAWYLDAVADLESMGAEWIIVSGHHPFRSNGRHGNAGNYESIEVGGIDIPNPVPILNGNFVRAFFRDVVCGTADVVFAGHDHNRQWLDEPDALCGAELIVSGAGAKTTDFEPDTNMTLFQDDTTPGFLYVVIEGDSFYGRFVDIDGMTNFENTVTRRP